MGTVGRDQQHSGNGFAGENEQVSLCEPTIGPGKLGDENEKGKRRRDEYGMR